MREYNRRPEVRERQRHIERKYNHTEAGRERARAYSRKWARRALGIANPTGETRRGPCPVCGRDGRLDLDHDHSTGQVRGWLCGNCNRGLGLIGDTTEAAQRLLAYLTPSATAAAPEPPAPDD